MIPYQESDKYGDGSTFTKYSSTDGKTVLDLEDDAARANLGGSWKIPTEAQFQELLDTANCTKAWTTVDGVNGYLFTSKANGNTLFIPAAGGASDGNVDGAGIGGGLWFNSLDSSNIEDGRCLKLSSSHGVDVSLYYRYYGYSVRGVVG